jgi:hypothetical protein
VEVKVKKKNRKRDAVTGVFFCFEQVKTKNLGGKKWN